MIPGHGARARTEPAWPIRTHASWKPGRGYSFCLLPLPRNITSMDAYAFALALGTAGLAAMTVLGFHHGHAPGRSGHGHRHSTHVRGADRAGDHRHHAGASSRLLLFLSPRLWFSLLVGFGGMARRPWRLRRSCPPAWDGQRAIERFGYILEWYDSREPGGAA
jgi:hypothetical protein